MFVFPGNGDHLQSSGHPGAGQHRNQLHPHLPVDLSTGRHLLQPHGAQVLSLLRLQGELGAGERTQEPRTRFAGEQLAVICYVIYIYIYIYIVGNRGLPWFMFFAFLVMKTCRILFFGPSFRQPARKASSGGKKKYIYVYIDGFVSTRSTKKWKVFFSNFEIIILPVSIVLVL